MTATLQKCACGCGLFVTPGKRWMRGHASRGSPEVQEKRERQEARRRRLAQERRELRIGAPPGSSLSSPVSGSARPTQAAGREPLPTPAPPRPKKPKPTSEPAARAVELPGREAIVAIVAGLLEPVDPAARHRWLRELLVDVRAEVHRRDVVRGVVAGEESEDDLDQSGYGQPGAGRRTPREPRHKIRLPHWRD